MGAQSLVAIANGLPPMAFTATSDVRVDTLVAIEDASVFQGQPGLNFGTPGASIVSQALAVGPNAGTWSTLPNSLILRSYLRFDLSSISQTANVTAADLKLSFRNSLSPGAQFVRTIELRLSSAAWSESTITWNNQPGVTGAMVANWDMRSCTTCIVDAKATVLSWLLGAPNNGFVLRSAQESTNPDHTVGYAAREDVAAQRRPMLIITWQP